MSDVAEMRLAVLIDADNVVRSDMKAIICEVAGDDGRCALSGLGSLLSKNRPDFDSRNYGYSQLSKLLRSIDRFEVTGSGGSLSVKDKSPSV